MVEFDISTRSIVRVIESNMAGDLFVAVPARFNQGLTIIEEDITADRW